VGRQSFAPRREAADAALVLGAAIRSARVERGWTQEQLGNAIGASARTIHSLERGVHTVSIGHVFSAAGVLGVPLFGEDREGLARAASSARYIESLLPKRVATPRRVVSDDDF
jgi:transcriptional regulator with XRE-family HTH domain